MAERPNATVLAILRRIGALVAAAAALAAGGTAAAAPPTGVLASGASDGPVAAYRDTVAWSAWDAVAGGYRVVVARDGQARTLPVPPSPAPFQLSAGPGAGGHTWLVWARCDADERTAPVSECDVEGYDVDVDTPRLLPFAARSGVLERAPSIWHDRLVYVTGRNLELPEIHLADLRGRRDRLVGALPATACGLSIVRECAGVVRARVQSTALRAQRLAVASRVNTSGGDLGVCGWANVGVLDLRTYALQRVDSMTCGISGQRFADLTFDAGGHLWWRLGCVKRAFACDGPRSGPFRLSGAGVRRLGEPDAGYRLLGVAMAGRTPVLSLRPDPEAPQCWTRAGEVRVYRCATIAAVPVADAARRLIPVPHPADDLPPSGYVTIGLERDLRVLWHRGPLPCVRGSAVRPRAGAELWVGTSWYRGRRPSTGPAVTVTARSAGRAVSGRVLRAPAGMPGQHTARIDLGTPAQACGRRWHVRYDVPGRRPFRFSVDVRRR